MNGTRSSHFRKREHQLDVVHGLHRCIGLSVGSEADKAKAPATTSVAVLDDYL